MEGLHTCRITVFGLVYRGAEESGSEKNNSETSLTVSVLKNRKCRLRNSEKRIQTATAWLRKAFLLLIKKETINKNKAVKV